MNYTMIKRFYILLLAIVASVGMMNAKVTWNSSNISDLYVSGTYQSYSKEGVTLSANADQIDAWWSGYGDESHDGISFNAHNTGGYTFSNTLGKNFIKIEMTLNGPAGWDMSNLGSGWSFSWDYLNDKPATVTWTGNASTVDLLKEASDFNGENVKSIVFYFVGDSEEPDPTYTVALKAGTVNADKVTLSATSAVEGATVTVTPDEEYEITAFKATYNTTEELSTSFNAETGAYSFTMPAYDVTIEATIALKPVPEGDIFAGFTATAGSGGFDNEGHANLVDNKFISSDWTKWCANDGYKSVPTGESGDACWWIDFEASAALNLTGYILTTGNDTGSEHGRNPKNWLLKAKLNADDAWTTIATVTNDVTMKNQSFKDYKFFVDQSGSYKYFRFEVFANQGASVMQLCQLRLIGTDAPATPAVIDLATITSDYVIPDGTTLTGTLGTNAKLSIAAGATVTLNGVNINWAGSLASGDFAGLNCVGNATIVLADGSVNYVKGFMDGPAGIHIAPNYTVTISGNGTLNVATKGGGAAIGSGYSDANGSRNGGNIVINGGTIYATGGNLGAGIGGGGRAKVVNITINGGIIYAVGGGTGAGIGGGQSKSNSWKSICGNITISSNVKYLKATKGSGAAHSIGMGSSSYSVCGTVTIPGGATGYVSTNP